MIDQNDVLTYLRAKSPLLVSNTPLQPDLWQGKLGQSLTILYVANALSDESLFEEGFNMLTICIEAIYSGQYPTMTNATLAHGMAGLGFVLHSLMEDGLIENDLESLLIDIDSFVYQGTQKYLQQRNLDYWQGGIGGLYFLCLRVQKRPEIKNNIEDLIKKILKINQFTVELGMVCLLIYKMNIVSHKIEKFILQIALSLQPIDAKTAYFLQCVKYLFPHQIEIVPSSTQNFPQNHYLIGGLAEQCLYWQKLYKTTANEEYKIAYKKGLNLLLKSYPISEFGLAKGLAGTLLLLSAHLDPDTTYWQQII